jgi:hypothetical protein
VEYQCDRIGIEATTVVLDFNKEIGATKIFQRKGCIWRHEKEMRAIFPLEKCARASINGREEAVLEIPSDAIAVVRMGNRSLHEYQEEVRKVLSEYEKSIPIERAELHEREERLVFVQM